MRGMTQKWIILKKDETVWELGLNVMIAVLGASYNHAIHSLTPFCPLGA